MAIVGVGSVKVTPDLSTFRRELIKGLKAIKTEFTVDVTANTTKAKAEVEAFVRKESGQNITKNLVIDRKSITAATAAVGALTKGMTTLVGSGLKLASVMTIMTAMSAVSGNIGIELLSATGTLLLLPGAALAAAAAFAAIKLGADGIKKAFGELKPTIDNLKTAVSKSFELSLLPAVNNLKEILPQLTVGLKGIATALGGVATRTTNILKLPQSMGALKTVLDETSRVIQNLGKFFAPVIAAFVQIGAIGLPIIRELTAGLGAAGQSFLAFTQSAAGMEQIRGLITGALDALSQLGAILGQVFGIVGKLFQGLQSGGAALGGTLLPILTAINNALGSAGMQAALGAIGKAFADVARTVGSTLGPVIQTVLPLLAQGLTAAAPGIQALVQGLGALIQGIAPALPAVGALAAALGSGLGQVATALGPILGDLAKILADTLASAIPFLVPVLTDLAKVLGDVLKAVIPLIGPLIQIGAAILKPLIGIVAALVPPFTQLVNSVLEAMKPMLPVIAASFQKLGEALAPLAGALGTAVVEIFKALLPVMPSLVDAVLALVNAFLPFIPVLTNWITIATPILGLIAQLIAFFLKLQFEAITPIINIFGQMATAVAGAMTKVQAIIQNVVNAVVGFFQGLLNKVTGSWDGIKNAITNASNRAREVVVNTFNNVVSFFGSIPGRILNALGDLGGLLVGAGRAIINGLLQGIKNAVSAVYDFVSGIAGKIAALKGPLSVDRKLLVPAGNAIISGLNRSLQDRFRDTLTLVSSMGNQISDTFGASADVSGRLTAAMSTQLNASADIATAPVIVNINTNENALRGFVTAEIEEGNRHTRRRVLAGIGG